MKVSYYPGCTLKTRAQRMDAAARSSLMALGMELVEPKRWTCCGVLPSLADDDVMRHLGSVRNLIRIKKEGSRKVVTACAMCYNSLARANLMMKGDGERKRTINLYFEEEEDYGGEVEVVHLLRFLRDEIGWDAIRKRVVAPLDGGPFAAYYGCTLLRPREVAIEPPGRPTILGDLLKALGATVVDFPEATRCCSSYQTVTFPDIAARIAAGVVGAAKKSGAAAIVTSCPLCDYNLQTSQSNSSGSRVNPVDRLPSYYFSELLAVALGQQTLKNPI